MEQWVNEDALQAACYQWCYKTYPALRRLLWAIPNGQPRTAKIGALLQATGTLAGVWDLHLFWRGQFYIFELKVKGATLTKDRVINGRLRFGQVEFGEAISQQGGKCYVIRSLEQFQEIINAIMNNG